MEEIHNFLIENKFVKKDNLFTKEVEVRGQIININGQTIQTPSSIQLVEFEYMGSGQIENITIHGYKHENIVDFIYDLDDFKKIFNFI